MFYFQLRFCSFCVFVSTTTTTLLYNWQYNFCFGMESATLFRCVIVCLPLCARLWIHAHARTHDTKIHNTHTFAQAQTTTGTQAEVVSLCSFEFAACAADDHFVCMCARDSVVEFAVVRWIQFNTNTHTLPTTHAHQRRPHSLFSLSIFCTHAYTPNGCNCVRAVRACVLITLAYVLALNTDCQKSNCTEWNEMKKKKRARFAVAPFLPLLLLTFFCHCCCRCRCLCCCQQHRAATAASASAAASFLFPSIIWHCVIINCCRAPLRRCSVLTTRQNEQQTAT